MLIPSEDNPLQDDIPTIEKISTDLVEISVESIQNDINGLSPQSSKKKISNQTESIKTFCRIRPFNGTNDIFLIKPDDDKVLQINSDKVLRNPAAQKQVNSYTFSKTFGELSTQTEVFDITCKQLVEDLLYKKKSGLIFTYGMTNAGKTFTVTGTPTSPGILPQSLKYLLDNFNNDKANSVLYCNFVEIYQEDVFDLLSNDPLGKNKFFKKKINVKENNRNIFYLSDATYIQLDTVEEFNNILNKGIAKKVHSATNLNQNSSRSHTIFKIIIREKDVVYDDPNILDISLSIVDLAGSERANRTETTGKELQEACKINQSLSILGKCLEAMKHNSIFTQKKMVPFRESKLTKLFCEYFQGEQNIIMITNINPRKEDFEETLRALNYSCIAKEIKPIKSRIINNNPMKKIVKVNAINTNKVKYSTDSLTTSVPLLTANSSKNSFGDNEPLDLLNENDDLNSNSGPNNTSLAIREAAGSNDTINNLILEIQKLRSEVNNFKMESSSIKDKEPRELKQIVPSVNSNSNQMVTNPYGQLLQQMMPNEIGMDQIQRGLMEALPMQRMPGVNLFFINSKFNDFHLAKRGLIPEENESDEEESNDDDYEGGGNAMGRRSIKKANKNKQQFKVRDKSLPDKPIKHAKRDTSRNNQLKKDKVNKTKLNKLKKKKNNKKGTIVRTPKKRISIPQVYEESEVLNSTIELHHQFNNEKKPFNLQQYTPGTNEVIKEEDIRPNIQSDKGDDSLDRKTGFFFKTQPRGKFALLNGF